MAVVANESSRTGRRSSHTVQALLSRKSESSCNVLAVRSYARPESFAAEARVSELRPLAIVASTKGIKHPRKGEVGGVMRCALLQRAIHARRCDDRVMLSGFLWRWNVGHRQLVARFTRGPASVWQIDLEHFDSEASRRAAPHPPLSGKRLALPVDLLIHLPPRSTSKALSPLHPSRCERALCFQTQL